MKKPVILGIAITAAVFWLSDFLMHFSGVGETNYYYTIKLANAFLFAFIWFYVFNKKGYWKKLLFSFIFGTWISFFYIITAYDGLVQFFGIEANYTAPPFVVFGIFMSKYIWWAFHAVVFYIGLEISDFVLRKNFAKKKRK